ncbi:unnamed protein product [Urochloa humidicola]
MTESATRQNTAAETLNPSSAFLSSACRTFSGTPPPRSHLLDPTTPPPPLPPPPAPATAAAAASDPLSLGGATFSAAAGSSPERNFAMVTADSFCGEPIGDARAEEAFGGVGGVESAVWVSARARVMLPDSLADSAASCSDLASEDDAGAEGGGGTGAGEGWGGERAEPERGMGGAESAAAMFGAHAAGEEKHRRWAEAAAAAAAAVSGDAEVRTERNRRDYEKAEQ